MTDHVSPWMTDELKLLRDTARQFFLREGMPHVARWERQQGVDREFWMKAGSLGLLCPTVPEVYGGAGGNILHHIVITEEQARTIDKGWGNPVHSGVVAGYLLSYGSEEQKLRWLPGMVSGETIAAIAMTEPSAGSDLQAIKTTAVRDGDEYIINGAKTFITNGGSADLILVAAKTDPTARGRGISLIVVDTRDCPGFVRGRVLDKIGQHAADTAELAFQDVRVPVSNRLGEEGSGFKMLMQQLPQERLFIGVGAVVPIELAVERTVEYAKDRELYGKPLLDLQNTRFELAECATVARVARTFIDSCIEKHLCGELDSATAAMAKLWLTDMQCQVIDRCLQLFGGYGYMREYPIARMYADARVQRIYGGANEVMKEVIARSL
ncbi:acyl-CoA dehydrogenase family protein [Rhodococcus sp. KBS0724]|uniref:acyl-CoA dehydrogenase family protein n=1 Tax=Rhodococcus sp. KBS0724 TaxID=1179674 RepID=UPI00163D609E|nr:acyl-CoA dehydrogenase family protein [Rhodococcus sp. KBS0724]